jgi:hypothetical protein
MISMLAWISPSEIFGCRHSGLDPESRVSFWIPAPRLLPAGTSSARNDEPTPLGFYATFRGSQEEMCGKTANVKGVPHPAQKTRRPPKEVPANPPHGRYRNGSSGLVFQLKLTSRRQRGKIGLNCYLPFADGGSIYFCLSLPPWGDFPREPSRGRPRF